MTQRPHALACRKLYRSTADTFSRQHFQGLRRAQHKADINGTVSDAPKKGDPTDNPITRRPGPGRGRPKKQVSASGSQHSPDTDDAAPILGLVQQPPLPPSVPAPAPPPPIDGQISGELPVPIALPTQDPASLGLLQDEDDLEEQPAKRQRLDDPIDHLDDSAGLALDDGHVDSMVHHDLPE